MKKNGNNEGSIHARKNGYFSASVTVDGKRIQKTFKTLKQAKTWRKEILRQIDEGLSFQGATYSLGAYLQDWLEGKRLTIKSHTYEQYHQVVKTHINPLLGNVKLKDIKTFQIEHFYLEKRKSGTSENTVYLIHRVLRGALRHAYLMGLITRNPISPIKSPKPPKKEMKTYDDYQARNLLQAAEETDLEALLFVELATGLRIGEIIGLKWSDLDMEKGTLRVCRQVQRVKGVGLVFSEPKSEKSRRMLILGPEAIKKIRKHAERQYQQKLFAGDRWEENDLIFPNSIGKPKEHNRLLKDFKAIAKKAGLPTIRFHDLRHSAATLMLQQEINPKIVQEILGHSDINLTLNTYSHVMPTLQREAASRLEELLTLTEVTHNREQQILHK